MSSSGSAAGGGGGSSSSSSGLAAQAVAWAVNRGLLMGYKSAAGLAVGAPEPECGFSHVPLSLFPAPVPTASFREAEALAPVFNALVDAIARDTAWLRATLSDTATADEFTGELLRIMEEVHEEGLAQVGGEILRTAMDAPHLCAVSSPRGDTAAAAPRTPRHAPRVCGDQPHSPARTRAPASAVEPWHQSLGLYAARAHCNRAWG
jgi:hypothetical protein